MTQITRITFLATAAVVFALALSACRSHPVPPQSYEFMPSADFNHDFDTVWTGVVDYFASENIGIKNLEKASGLIVAERHYSDPRSVYFDCGHRGSGEIYRDVLGEFNVFVRPVSEDLQRVTVNTRYWVSIDYPGGLMRRGRPSNTRSCNSTGEMERLLLTRFRERMEQG